MTTRELINALRGLYVTVDFAKYIEPGLNFESLSKAADRLEELEKQNEAMMKELCDKEDLVREAEGRFYELEKELDTLKNATKKWPEWISVEERLPGLRKNIIGVNKETGRSEPYYFIEYGAVKANVTHWMYFPTPPKPKEPNICKYRKKPIVVEAYQTDRTIVIPTLEGDMIAGRGDYIITGVDGEQYPCKPDIFEKTYEPYFEEEGGE